MDKTDFMCISELDEKWTPKQKMIIDDDESNVISGILELNKRTNIELLNIRDMCVLYFSSIIDRFKLVGRIEAIFDVSDKMSAVTTVIDQEKAKRGMPV